MTEVTSADFVSMKRRAASRLERQSAKWSVKNEKFFGFFINEVQF
jgi:hypothetical protein